MCKLEWRTKGHHPGHYNYDCYIETIKAPVTPDRTILWSYDWLRFGQLRPIGNVCCDLLLQSHALVYSLRLVVGHMLICMIIYYLYLLASCRQVYVNNLSKLGVDNA